MKRKFIALLSIILLMSTQLSAVSAAKQIPDETDYYVNDYMEVLSQDTIDTIAQKNDQLENGAEIVIVTTDYINTDTEEFAYQLFNQWQIGDKEENNGVLIVLVVNEEKYWVTVGTGLNDVLDAGTLSDILYDYMENDFDAKDYDQAVLNTFNAIYEIVGKKYGLSNTVYQENNYQGGNVMGEYIIPILFFVLMLIVIAAIVASPGPSYRRRFRPRPHHEPRRYREPYHGGFGGGPSGPRSVRRPTNSGPRPSASRPTRSTHSSSGRSSGMRSGGGGGTRGGGAGRK